MKKFTKLNESNKTVNTSTNKNDFIKNLIEETLSINDNEIKGKDVLVEAIQKIIEMNDSKTIISVLENVKAKSFHSFSFEWVNEVINNEKEKINNPKIELIKETVEEVEMINEAAEETINKDIEMIEDLSITGDIEGIDEIDIEEAGLESEEDEECKTCTNKDDYEIGDIVYINIEGPTKAEITKLDDEEISLMKLDDKDEALTDGGEMTFKWNDFNEIIDKDKKDDFINPVDIVEEDDIIIEESINFMSDIDELSKILESINNEQINEEHHLETKQERIDFILSNIEKEEVKEIVFNLPDYVKTSDIDETLKNLSDNEIENLYLKVEEIN